MKYLELFTAEILNLMALAAIILFGALVNATNQYNLSLQTERSFNLRNWLIALILSSFSGLMTGLFASFYIDSQTFILISAGMGAFLGIETINTLGRIVLDTLKGFVNR